jgi:hypothetical protein
MPNYCIPLPRNFHGPPLAWSRLISIGNSSFPYQRFGSLTLLCQVSFSSFSSSAGLTIFGRSKWYHIWYCAHTWYYSTRKVEPAEWFGPLSKMIGPNRPADVIQREFLTWIWSVRFRLESKVQKQCLTFLGKIVAETKATCIGIILKRPQISKSCKCLESKVQQLEVELSNRWWFLIYS